jgi:hypothetical protein
MPTATLNSSAESRKLDIDFLFLDLNTCTRCVGTNANLEKALASVAQVLSLIGVEQQVNKILIDSMEKAQAYGFVTSPTIRVNGRDIALETKESLCDSCTDLCGCDEGTNCRVWVYRGKEYTEAPEAMIVEAVLQEIFGAPQLAAPAEEQSAEVPENLQHFFAGKTAQDGQPAPACCSATERQTCCAPAAKSACCSETAQPNGCGCK